VFIFDSSSLAYGVSADGSIVVGWGEGVEVEQEADIQKIMAETDCPAQWL